MEWQEIHELTHHSHLLQGKYQCLLFLCLKVATGALWALCWQK